MDDMKRAIYMEVLREIKELEKTERDSDCWFICLGLVDKLKEIVGGFLFSGGYTRRECVEEFFPEFVELSDGGCWTREGVHFSKEISGAWWAHFWAEPRTRIIEFILNNR